MNEPTGNVNEPSGSRENSIRVDVHKPPIWLFSALALFAIFAIVLGQWISAASSQAQSSCRAGAQAAFNKTLAEIIVSATDQDRGEIPQLAMQLQHQANAVDNC